MPTLRRTRPAGAGCLLFRPWRADLHAARRGGTGCATDDYGAARALRRARERTTVADRTRARRRLRDGDEPPEAARRSRRQGGGQAGSATHASHDRWYAVSAGDSRVGCDAPAADHPRPVRPNTEKENARRARA